MSKRTLTIKGLTTLCVLAATLMLAATPASAGFIHKYLSQITEVPNQPGVLAPGPFGDPYALASDGQNIYVGDRAQGVIDEFTENGGFVRQFSAAGLESMAVSHTTGEIYIGNGPEIDVYSPTGVLLGTWNAQDTPTGPFSGRAIVAIDNTPNTPARPTGGDVYVLDTGTSTVDVFKPEAGGKEKYVTNQTLPNVLIEGYTAFGVEETTGNMIVARKGNQTHYSNKAQVFKPTVSGGAESLYEIEAPIFGAREFAGINGLAMDRSTGDIYVDSDESDNPFTEAFEPAALYQYSASGTYLYELSGAPNGFGIPGGVVVLSTGEVYVADHKNGELGENAIDIFSPDIPTPDVTTTLPSKAAGMSINGTVNPNGTPIVKCEFEYGLTSSYGSTIPCTALPSGNAPKSVTAVLPDLASHTIYHYRLLATDEEGYTSYGQETVFPTAPVVTGSALVSNMTSFAVTLTGVIEPGAITPSYHFVYGTTTAYGSTWPQPDATTGTGGQQPVLQTLTGLQPGTTYHFALVATNFGGFETIGPDQTFTTRPLVPPAVSTGGSEAIAQTTATLAGSVNPEALPTTYHFEYGQTTAYGSIWPLVQVFAGAGSTTQGVAVTVPNLQPGTAYHYRLVATNEDGTTYGPDQSFATPAYPASIVQEPTTLPGVKAPAPKTTKPPAKKTKKKTTRKKAHHGSAKRKRRKK